MLIDSLERCVFKQMSKRRVVVTGMGTVNPIGNNVNESFEALKVGKCGIGPITHFDTTDFKVKLAAEVKDFNPEDFIEKKELRKMGHFIQLAIVAAMEAWEDAGFDDSLDKDEAGVIISSGIGGLPNIEEECIKGYTKGFNRVSPYFVPSGISNMAAAKIAIKFGLKGICTCPVTACAGGTNAVGDAFIRVRDGYETVMVCGGTESSINQLGIAGFTNMQALSTATDANLASLPFDARRGGFVMGEGSGVLILEEREHAIKRGAKIYAEVLGYGANCDAYHYTAPDPEGIGAKKCIEKALKDANLSADKIDYINAHGTGTKLNDACETKACHMVFGDHAKDLLVSSTKAMTGHLLGGAGGVEAVFTALSLYNGFVPPTINLESPDPECDLNYVPNNGINKEINYAMSNSLGFGGHNACIILGKAQNS